MSMTSAAAIPMPEKAFATRIHTGWSRFVVAVAIVAAGFALSRAIDDHGGSAPSTSAPAERLQRNGCSAAPKETAATPPSGSACVITAGGALIKRPVPLPSSSGS